MNTEINYEEDISLADSGYQPEDVAHLYAENNFLADNSNEESKNDLMHERSAYDLILENPQNLNEEIFRLELENIKAKLNIDNDDFLFYLAALVQKGQMRTNNLLINDFQRQFLEFQKANQFDTNAKVSEVVSICEAMLRELKANEERNNERVVDGVSKFMINVSSNISDLLSNKVGKLVDEIQAMKSELENDRRRNQDLQRQTILKTKEENKGAPMFYGFIGAIVGAFFYYVLSH